MSVSIRLILKNSQLWRSLFRHLLFLIRALMLAALQSVDGVCIFTEIRAMTFLEEVQPDIYVKGGDYTLETLDQEERRVVEKHGGRIVLLPFIPGHSTTELVQKITR